MTFFPSDKKDSARCSGVGKKPRTLRLGKPYKNLSPAQKTMLRGNYVIHKHANGWRVPLKQWGWPKEFEELVCWCWHEDMDKRPTFKQVMGILESWKADMFNVN